MSDFPKGMPRDAIHPDYYLPRDITMAEWNNVLDAIGVGDDTYVELRGTPTAKVLNNFFPILKNPDKGLSLEFDLTNNNDLFVKVDNLIDNYSDTIKQSSRYLATTISLNKDSVAESSQAIPSTSPEALEYTSLINYITTKLRSIINMLDAIKAADVGISYDPSTRRTKIEFIITMLTKIYTTGSSKGVAKDLIPSIAVTVSYRDIFDGYYSAIVQSLRIEFSQGKEGTAFNDQASALEDFIDDNVLGANNTTDVDNGSFKLLVVRLYPVAAQLGLGTPSPVTTKLSNSRFIQTKLPRSNIRASLKNNIALNTPDTQWFDFYTSLFEYIVDYGNPQCTLRFGNDKLKGCYLMEPLRFIKNNDSVLGFDLNLISKSVGSELEEA